MIVITLKLLLAHVLGDFLFQSAKAIKHKQKHKHKSPYLYIHVIIHGLLVLLLLGSNTEEFIIAGIIVVTHYIIDLTKLHVSTKENGTRVFVIDQLAHIAVIAAIINYYFPVSWTFISLIDPDVQLFILAFLLAVIVPGIVLKVVMNRWEIIEDQKDSSLENAGHFIGILERLFVFLFIILNQWQAIGFLIAAKSIFRFSDLSRAKDRKLTEYILIGTLFSYAMAVIVGLAYISFKTLI